MDPSIANNKDVHFEYCIPKLWGEDTYYSLDPAQNNASNVQASLHAFWQQAQSTLNPSLAHGSIRFHEKALYPLMQALETNSLKVRLRCRAYPQGKGGLLPLSHQAFYLPLPPRKTNGQLSKPNEWAEASQTIKLHDYTQLALDVNQKILETIMPAMKVQHHIEKLLL